MFVHRGKGGTWVHVFWAQRERESETAYMYLQRLEKHNSQIVSNHFDCAVQCHRDCRNSENDTHVEGSNVYHGRKLSHLK
jgi:hypothetical protein